MSVEVKKESFCGARRLDGSVVGFDYTRQVWVDTSPDVERDETKKPGSASNPLKVLDTELH